MIVLNTLAFLATELITGVKSFMKKVTVDSTSGNYVNCLLNGPAYYPLKEALENDLAYRSLSIAR